MRETLISCAERNAALLPWPRLARLLEELALDALIVSTPENVTYVGEYAGLSHWARRGTQVYAVAWRGSERSVDLIVPATLADQVTDHVAGHSRTHAYGMFSLDAEPGALGPTDARTLELATSDANRPDSLTALDDVLRSGLPARARVAVEPRGLANGVLSAVADAFPAATLLPADDLLAAVRAVKSPREVELLRTASRITEQAVATALAGAEPGSSEEALARRFVTALVADGAAPETTVIGTGRRSALPNAAPTGRRLVRGDILRFDVGCRYAHYVSDIARTASLGIADGEPQALYRALSDGLEAAAQKLQPGATGADVFGAAVNAVRDAGLPDYRRTHCGHGIGIANYDAPRITAESEDVIEPGMVICLETPYYRLGSFGLQVEDTFVVTDVGAERLTIAPRKLVEIPVGSPNQ
jgi:Xaa-Pro dipeptidase